MTVFKGYLKITKRNVGLIMMYLAIFMGITMAMQALVKGSESSYFSPERLKIGVVNEDNSVMADSLIAYLKDFHDVTMLENKPEVLQENLYYRNVEYIVKIPANFVETSLINNEKMQVTKVPGTYSGFYVDQQLNSFINNARTYLAAGFSNDETAEAMKDIKTAKVTIIDQNGNGSQPTAVSFYFRYLPYLFVSVLCYILGNILIAFHRGKIPERMEASPVSLRRQTLEGLVASGCIAFALWVLIIAAAFVIYNKTFINSAGFLYYIVNALILMTVCLAMAYMLGMLVKGPNALAGMVNVVSLGMSFLCGVFVDMKLLSSSVRTVAQFLPVYWYEQANEILRNYGSYTGVVKNRLFQAMGIQIVFVAAFICITMVIARSKRQ